MRNTQKGEKKSQGGNWEELEKKEELVKTFPKDSLKNDLRAML